MKAETREKIRTTLKAYWTPERRKAHGAKVRQGRKDAMWENAWWEADYEEREMSEWPHPPFDQPPSYPPEVREWMNRQEHNQEDLEYWRTRALQSNAKA